MAAGADEAGARWRAKASGLGIAIATRPTTDSPANRTWRMTSIPDFLTSAASWGMVNVRAVFLYPPIE